MKIYALGDCRFHINDGRAEIFVGDSRDRVWCTIEQARNVYRAVREGRIQQTLEEIRLFLEHAYLFDEYDEARGSDCVPVIAIRKDATAHIIRYTWEEWTSGVMLGRDLAYSKRCSDGKVRQFAHE